MSLEDPTMGATFPAWTSAAERDPPKFDPGKLHTGTGIKDWWFQDGYLFRERDGIAISAMDERLWWDQIGNYEFIEGCQWSVEESAATKKVTPGKSELALNTMPAWGVEGETPEEGEWPKRDAVPFVETIREGRYTIAGIVEGEKMENPEWPARDRVPFVVTIDPDGMRHKHPIGLRPAEVTEEMRRVGEQEAVAQGFTKIRLGGGDVTSIFQAMHAAAPVPLVSDAEIALTRDAYAEQHRRAIAEVVYLASEVVALRAELMAAHDRLAKFTVVPDPLVSDVADRICAALAPWMTAPLHRMAYEDAARAIAHPLTTNEGIANAIRQRETDRRGIGG